MSIAGFTAARADAPRSPRCISLLLAMTSSSGADQGEKAVRDLARYLDGRPEIAASHERHCASRKPHPIRSKSPPRICASRPVRVPVRLSRTSGEGRSLYRRTIVFGTSTSVLS